MAEKINIFLDYFLLKNSTESSLFFQCPWSMRRQRIAPLKRRRCASSSATESGRSGGEDGTAADGLRACGRWRGNGNSGCL